MTTEHFAELLIFLRTHPAQKQQLLKELSQVVAAAAPEDSEDYIRCEEACAMANARPRHLALMLRHQHIHSMRHPRTRALLVHREQLRSYVERQQQYGMCTYDDAIAQMGITMAALRSIVDKGHVAMQDGWMRRQDIVDYIMRHSPRRIRMALVQRMDQTDRTHHQQLLRAC